METSLPTPTTARVELLIYIIRGMVTSINISSSDSGAVGVKNMVFFGGNKPAITPISIHKLGNLW